METTSEILNEKNEKKKLYTLDEVYNLNVKDVHSLYSKYINKTRVELLSVFGFGNELVESAEGVWITLKNGKKVLDFTGGIGILNHGHNHPRLLKARIDFQNKKRMEVHKNYFSQYVAALSHNLAQLLPGGLQYSFFPNSGSEAVDGALKTAYKYHDMKRAVVLYSDIAFHGKQFGPASVTHSPENHFPYPKIPNTKMFEFNNIESVKSLMRENRKENGESNVAGIIVEPFNVNNMRPTSYEFLAELRKICSTENVVLIYDEIYSGWCKMGSLFYFMRYENIAPDVLCMSKSFGGGKSSISAFITRKEVFEKSFLGPMNANLQSSTYYGFGEESITAIEAINIAIEDNYVGRAKNIEKLLVKGLDALQKKYPSIIKKHAGSGALHGLFFNEPSSILQKMVSFIPGEFYKDPNFLLKLVTASVISAVYDNHSILSFTSLGVDIHMIISPPLIIKDEEIEMFIDALDKTLDKGIVSLVTKFAAKKFLGQ